ncbi:hypothetical protein [Streptomyces xanthophaeus]|uniref:hypothetical protein n=1 Tax=Streptomyces xanthophaeus TaxID=67385 RepID=UPI00371182BF
MKTTLNLARTAVGLSAVMLPLVLAVPASAEPEPLSLKEINAFACAKEPRSYTYYAEIMNIETMSTMSWHNKKNPYAQARQDLFGIGQLNDYTRDETCGDPQKKTEYKKLIGKYAKEYDNAPGVTLRTKYKDPEKIKNFHNERIAAYSAAIRAEQARAGVN